MVGEMIGKEKDLKDVTTLLVDIDPISGKKKIAKHEILDDLPKILPTEFELKK